MDPATLAAGAGLASAASWGAGDFCGGLAARRSSPFLIAAFVQVVGVALLVLLALAVRDPIPATSDLAWGAAAGVAGVVGLLALYAALAGGTMGIAAPVAGVVTAILPVSVGIVLEGSPGAPALAGFALALGGIALVSGGRGASGGRALGFAALAGVGFGFFLALLGQASTFLWPLVAARVGSAVTVGAALLVRRPSRGEAPWPLLVAAGLADTGGNAFFLAAAQLGRLDVAAVLSSLYPAGTVLLARVVLKERLTWPQLAGVAAMLVAIVLVAWR